MTLATRLLAVTRGGGSVVLPALPADAAWARHASNPVMAPTQAWEETSVQEPTLLYEGGWKMWYKGGWASGGAIGYATSADGISWTKDGGNPVFGRGGSGLAATVSQPQIFKDGSTYYLYYNSPADTVNSPYVATSSDGLVWTVEGTYISSGSITSWGNRGIWIDGGTWYQLLEGRVGAGIWQIYLASSPDGLTYSFLNSGNPLTTLQAGGGYNYGGPFVLPLIYGDIQAYYHSGASATSDIYRATSADKISWTIQNAGSPVITHTGSSPETDQVADPHVQLHDGTWYMWWAAVDNTANTGRIQMATA